MQVIPPSTGTPDPLVLITRFPVDELLEIVTCPVAVPELVGANFTVMVAVCPWLRVIGVVIPEAVSADPATEIEEMVTDEVPDEVRVTELVTD